MANPCGPGGLRRGISAGFFRRRGSGKSVACQRFPPSPPKKNKTKSGIHCSTLGPDYSGSWIFPSSWVFRDPATRYNQRPFNCQGLVWPVAFLYTLTVVQLIHLVFGLVGLGSDRRVPPATESPIQITKWFMGPLR